MVLDIYIFFQLNISDIVSELSSHRITFVGLSVFGPVSQNLLLVKIFFGYRMD